MSNGRRSIAGSMSEGEEGGRLRNGPLNRRHDSVGGGNVLPPNCRLHSSAAILYCVERGEAADFRFRDLLCGSKLAPVCTHTLIQP